jgi:hypothetical protein
MSNMAHLDTATLDTAAKFFCTMQKAGADFTGPMQSVAKRHNLVAYLEMGCPKINNNGEIVTPTLPDGEEHARSILGDDYLSPEDVVKAYGWSYSGDQLENFANTLPDTETVLWLRSNGYMLVATPPTDCSTLQVRDLDNKIFSSKTEGWYAKDKQRFARNDVVKAGQWLMVRKEPYADSRSKKRNDQQKLLTEVEHVPSAPEMAYAVTAYFKARGIYLLKGVYVRTSSVDADGGRVIVGFFDVGGLIVDHYYDDDRDDYVGISSSRKTLDSLNT